MYRSESNETQPPCVWMFRSHMKRVEDKKEGKEDEIQIPLVNSVPW